MFFLPKLHHRKNKKHLAMTALEQYIIGTTVLAQAPAIRMVSMDVYIGGLKDENKSFRNSDCYASALLFDPRRRNKRRFLHRHILAA
jgi:hypothetical protein